MLVATVPIEIYPVFLYAVAHGHTVYKDPQSGKVKLDECPYCARHTMMSFYPNTSKPEAKTIFDGCPCGYRSHEL